MSGSRTLISRRIPGALVVGLLVAMLAALVSCSGRQASGDEKEASAVAQSSPKLQPVPAVPPAPVRERVPSQGDCAPHYSNGGKGTCINNQPCRGFGVRAESGSPVCTCFGHDGGCQEGQRCDPMRLACIPEDEPPFGRSKAQ
jgi:hypothetical protein